MKRIIALILAALMLLGMLAGCGESVSLGSSEQQEAEASGMTLHKIGVATYNINDAQVRMFKDYLDNYIKSCFVDVTFIYSDSISSGDDMMDFLQVCADNGAEGVMFFYTADLKREVEFCAANGMYCIRPSGNVSDEEFQSVADNPYFIGEIGPGAELEYTEAVNMTKALAGSGDGYVILSGGAFMGNEMHRQRTIAILDTLQEIYGVTLDRSSEELAVVSSAAEVSAGGLRLVVCPGYMEIPQYVEAAEAAIRSGEYATLLSAIPVTPLMDALKSVQITCGTIDCFSEDNFFGFKKDKVGYVAGKYQSEIGPAFAALFNAITGNAEAFRVDGRAFRLQQGFWTAASSDEYDRMYALANGAAINAYNYEDIFSVVKSLTPEATFEDFKALTESWSYDDCLARRSA